MRRTSPLIRLAAEPALVLSLALCALGALLATAGDSGASVQLAAAAVGVAVAYLSARRTRIVTAAAAAAYLAVEAVAGRIALEHYWKDVLGIGLLVAAVHAARTLRERLDAADAAAASARAQVADLLHADEIDLVLAGGTPVPPVEREVLRSRRHQHTASVAVLRPDGIDELAARDRAAADARLRAVAETVASELRTTDLGFRRGTFEIGVLLPETDLAGARVAAERLRLAVAATGVATVSVGVAAYPMSNAAEEVEAHAEEALEAASRQGGNRTFLSARTPQSPPGWSVPSIPRTRD